MPTEVIGYGSTAIAATPPSNTSTPSPSCSASQRSKQYDEEDALRVLSSMKADSPVKWDDVSAFLPSAAHCLRLFSFYFDELLPDVSFIDKTSLLNQVEALWQAEGSISRQEAAIVFWILTHACLTIPYKHPLRCSSSSSSIDLEEGAERYHKVAKALQTPSLTHMSRYEMLLDASLHALEALWYGFQSNFEANWQSTGAGLRRAAALHLFSTLEKRSRQKQPTGQDEIIIHTSHLTQKLLVMDRWIAFTDLRAYGVHPSEVSSNCFEDGRTPCLRAWIEDIQVRLLEDAREFVLDCDRGLTSRQELYTRLMELLEVIGDRKEEVINRYLRQTAVSLDPVLCAHGESGPLAAVLISWLAACTFIGCSAAMPFACDSEAPLDIRMAGLRCASNMMNWVPMISSIYQHGMQALRVSRLSNHLFYALRAVILTLAGLDLQPSLEERDETESLLLGRSNWTPAMSAALLSPHAMSYPSEAAPHVGDLALIREQFNKSMNLLELFSSIDGNRTAKRALTLVNDVLAVNSALAATLGRGDVLTQAKSYNSADRSRELFANEWSFAKNGMMRDATSITNSNSAFQPSSQEAIDAMLLQEPQINFLSPDDIDQILANFGSGLV